jgi:hypothetical protein
MWLVAVWLAFADHLPRTRPSAGMAANIWDLGGHLGKGAVFAALTFAAYLIGAVAEFDPTRLWRSRGVPSASAVLRTIRLAGGVELAVGEESATRKNQSLEESLEELRADMSGGSGVEVMEAFATKLQASNTELFGRYDRLQAEASLRLNIAMPLATLLELTIWRSQLLFWVKLPLSLVPIALGALLLRQSLLRVRSANQVLIMAERVGIFDETPSIINPPSS